MGSVVVRGRQQGLVRKDIGDEVVLFDTRTEEVHLLNPSLAAVWRASLGGATDADLGRALGSVLGTVEGIGDLVALAVEELRRADLLDGDADVADGGGTPGLSRRALLKKAGIAALALPAITTILAPPVAAAVSGVPCLGGNQPCSNGAQAAPCCGTLTCRSTTTGQKCCNTNLGVACGGTAVCCEGACTSGTCCHQVGGGTCTPGQHLQCCGSAVCNNVGACVACTAAGTAPTGGDASLCCSAQKKGTVCCDPAVGASCEYDTFGHDQCCGPNVCLPGAKKKDPEFCGTCVANGSDPPDKRADLCCSGKIDKKTCTA